ncbi:MAG: hypothetical protein CBB68_09815 [Rhodospirillaceae bacterium TMED8]|nr:flagellar biosynthetic protein FliR [Magnetovibrio sp.]OUT50153.1 MAG: hypothetical protein CBB68_09815 [Rhodospirillaceae bacterium TMED8]
MLEEILTLNIFAFMLIFARLGSAFSFMPGFSASYISVRMRLALALAVSFAVMPMLATNLPVPPPDLSSLAVLILSEVVIGSFIGLIGQVLIGALQTAGTLIALSSAMANALIQDPIAEQQSSTISGFLLTTGMVILFVSDTHHMMILAAIETYSLFPPGNALPLGDFADMFSRTVADSFRLGLQLASPAIVIGLTYSIGLGILGRLMPALPVFFFGLPIQITVQLWVLTVTLSGIMFVWITHFQERMGAFAS